MKRTIAYIDGFNLYYGLLRHTRNKWRLLEAFMNDVAVNVLKKVAA